MPIKPSHRNRTRIALLLLLLSISGIASAFHASHNGPSTNVRSLAAHQLRSDTRPSPHDNSGSLIWRYQTGAAADTSPVIVNGVLYFGSGDSYVYALTAGSGSLLWRYQTGSRVSSSPAVVNGVVYIGSSDSYVYALNASTGALLWRYQTGNGVNSSPAVVNGVVYIGSSDSYVYALNASTGALLWRYQTGPSVSSSPAVANGIVYIGSVFYVYALNASTGALLWRYQTFNRIDSTPAVVNGIVYIGSDDFYVYALNASTGALLWRYQTGAPVPSTPAVVNGIVYIGSVDFYVYALNASTGTLLWHYKTGSSVSSSPAVINGVLYVGSRDSYIYALIAGSGLQGPQGPERNGDANLSENTQVKRCACDPIDTYSGNFSHTFTDLAISGRGIPLLFGRTYNAGAASQNGLLGYGWTDSYTMSLAINQTSGSVTVNQENGSTVTFTPDQQGGYTAPSRVLATLVQNHDGSFTFMRKDRIHYLFDSSGQLTQEVDRKGSLTSLTYQKRQLSTVTDSAGRSLTFTWTGSHITSVTDPLKRRVSFAYDQNGNLMTATDVNGVTSSFTYDSNHLLLTMTGPNGGVTANVYDTSNRVVSQSDPMGRTTAFSYGTDLTTITDPLGHVTVEHYQNAILVSETKGDGTPQAATWSYTYDPNTLGVATITDPAGHVWTKTWDSVGNLLSQTDPLGHTTTYTYDSLNDVTSVTDPLHVTTTLMYDAHGNLLSASRPLLGTNRNQVITYTYADQNHPGDVTAMTDPDGNTWSYSYDTNGNQISSTDPLGHTASFQFNGLGWKTAGVSPLRHTASYSYDLFGDVTLITDPLGHTTTKLYDAARNAIQVTDANGKTTRYAYDKDRELTRVTRADGSTLGYGYDGDGNQVSYTDGLGHVTTYTYDPLKRVSSTTDPLQRTTRYSYDLVGNLTALTDPAGQVTTESYDAANELTSISYSEKKTPTVTYTYDAGGERLGMIDGTGTTSYRYDSLKRLIQSTNGAGSTVGYSYDLTGQLTGLTYPDGSQVTRTFDAAGRLTAVQDWLGHTTQFSYDAESNLIGETYANHVQGTFTYDQNDRVTSITDSLSGNILLRCLYTRTTLELLQSLQSTCGGRITEAYSYTSLNQLSAVNQVKYQYDHGDNLTQDGPATMTFDLANEVTSQTQGTSTIQFSYDTRGNRTQMKAPGGQVTLSTYDQANRLMGYGTTEQYAYNGDGLRMSKTVVKIKTTEAFTWDVAEALPLLVQDATTRYVYGPGGLPLEQMNSKGTVLYYHQDQLGSTRALTDATGKVVAAYTYDAYGKVKATSKVANPFQYAGQYTDAESGLQYLHARYYDPSTGQFLSRDPLIAKTRSAYGYVAGNPLNATDPAGLDGVCDNGNWRTEVGYSACNGVLNCPNRAICLMLRQAIGNAYALTLKMLSAAQSQHCQDATANLTQQKFELGVAADALANNKLNDPNFDPEGHSVSVWKNQGFKDACQITEAIGGAGVAILLGFASAVAGAVATAGGAGLTIAEIENHGPCSGPVAQS